MDFLGKSKDQLEKPTLSVMGIEVSPKWLSKRKGFRDLRGFKVSKPEALKNCF